MVGIEALGNRGLFCIKAYSSGATFKNDPGEGVGARWAISGGCY
jgi:hypothetical protein